MLSCATGRDGSPTAIISAPARPQFSVTRAALLQGLQVDARDNYQFTPLHSAANGGHVATIRRLVSRRGCASWLAVYTLSPCYALICCVAGRNTLDVPRCAQRVLTWLPHCLCITCLQVDLKHDLNARDYLGRTPLHYAAMHGRVGAREGTLGWGGNGDGEEGGRGWISSACFDCLFLLAVSHSACLPFYCRCLHLRSSSGLGRTSSSATCGAAIQVRRCDVLCRAVVASVVLDTVQFGSRQACKLADQGTPSCLV